MTPKQEFMQSKERLAAHARLIDDPQISHSLNTAMLEYVHLLGRADNANEAAANQFRLQGAMDYQKVFLALGLNLPKPTPKPSTNLDHTV